MLNQANVVNIEDRIASLKEERGDNVAVSDIASVVESLVKGTHHDNELEHIAHELHELLNYITVAKSELIGVQAKSLSNRDIPDANVQLEAVVTATDEAANSIMDAAEQLETMSDELDGEVSDKLANISTNLFQASSFQDITGQRISKVNRTLAELETRLNSLADAIGDEYIEEPEGGIETDEEGIAVNDEDLLHGPQLEGEGNSQADIDALLASFD